MLWPLLKGDAEIPTATLQEKHVIISQSRGSIWLSYVSSGQEQHVPVLSPCEPCPSVLMVSNNGFTLFLIISTSFKKWTCCQQLWRKNTDFSTEVLTKRFSKSNFDKEQVLAVSLANVFVLTISEIFLMILNHTSHIGMIQKEKGYPAFVAGCSRQFCSNIRE